MGKGLVTGANLTGLIEKASRDKFADERIHTFQVLTNQIVVHPTLIEVCVQCVCECKARIELRVL